MPKKEKKSESDSEDDNEFYQNKFDGTDKSRFPRLMEVLEREISQNSKKYETGPRVLNEFLFV